MDMPRIRDVLDCYPKGSSPSHTNSRSKGAICICTGAFCHCTSVGQKATRDGPAKLHISLSEFQCNVSVFKTLKIWVDLLQAEPSSLCLCSGLASIRNKAGNVRPPASPHSCHMNVEVGFGAWRCFGGGLQTPYKFKQGLTVRLTHSLPVLNTTKNYSPGLFHPWHGPHALMHL